MFEDRAQGSSKLLESVVQVKLDDIGHIPACLVAEQWLEQQLQRRGLEESGEFDFGFVLFSMFFFYLLLRSKPLVCFFFFLIFSKWLNVDNSDGVQGDTCSTMLERLRPRARVEELAREMKLIG